MTRKAITLRLTQVERTSLEALKEFTGEGTATKAVVIAIKHYPDTCRELQEAEADRDEAQRMLRQLHDALDATDNAQSALKRVIQDLPQRAVDE